MNRVRVDGGSFFFVALRFPVSIFQFPVPLRNIPRRAGNLPAIDWIYIEFRRKVLPEGGETTEFPVNFPVLLLPASKQLPVQAERSSRRSGANAC
jgi:hypothetical protein